MSTIIERPEERGLVTAPQVGAVAVSARVEAEAKAALAIAASRPRDEVDAMDRIKNSCQRLGLAQSAEYCYSRGGQEITGPTIKLLEVVSGCWGNIQSGFRVLSSTHQESVVEAFAWDMETNNKKVMEFTVKHIRSKRSGNESLSDPRDIYELIANMAQRRVRKCLESVIPYDVVEDAVKECQATLKAKCDVTPERIKAMAEKFLSEYKVSRDQLEAKIQRRLESITPAQFLSLGKIYNSLKDGMSKADDWFPPITVEGETKEPETLKEKLKSKTKKPKSDEEEFAEAAAADGQYETGDSLFNKGNPDAEDA